MFVKNSHTKMVYLAEADHLAVGPYLRRGESPAADAGEQVEVFHIQSTISFIVSFFFFLTSA